MSTCIVSISCNDENIQMRLGIQINRGLSKKPYQNAGTLVNPFYIVFSVLNKLILDTENVNDTATSSVNYRVYCRLH